MQSRTEYRISLYILSSLKLRQDFNCKITLVKSYIISVEILILTFLKVILIIMFHVPMERFQLELIYCFTFTFHHRPI